MRAKASKAKKAPAKKPRVLAGGNPQIAKANGDAPVTGKDARWIDVHADDLDEKQMAAWAKQAAAIPGWDGSSRR